MTSCNSISNKSFVETQRGVIKIATKSYTELYHSILVSNCACFVVFSETKVYCFIYYTVYLGQ